MPVCRVCGTDSNLVREPLTLGDYMKGHTHIMAQFGQTPEAEESKRQELIVLLECKEDESLYDAILRVVHERNTLKAINDWRIKQKNICVVPFEEDKP